MGNQQTTQLNYAYGRLNSEMVRWDRVYQKLTGYDPGRHGYPFLQQKKLRQLTYYQLWTLYRPLLMLEVQRKLLGLQPLQLLNWRKIFCEKEYTRRHLTIPTLGDFVHDH